MKKAWSTFAALVACAVSCGGSEEASVGTAEGAFTYCGASVISLTATTNSSGFQPAYWTGVASLRQVPQKVVVSSNMPTSGGGVTHTLDFGAVTAGGGFRVDTSCAYKGKTFNWFTSQYEATLQNCTINTPNRLFTFDKARLQSSGLTLPLGSTTWTVTAQVSEILDDQNACTADACGAGGMAATHTPITGPGCTAPNPLGSPQDATLTANVAEDASAIFANQTGTPGALDPRRAAIVRGYVYETDGSGQAVLAPDVVVSVLGHPELGWIKTRGPGNTVGTFELAVNGGGKLTLNYQKAGTLGAQRPVNLRWHEFRKVDDVQLVSHNDGLHGTLVHPSTGGIVRGATVSDARGTRRATMFVPAGTTSPSIAGDDWNVHVTEFTVGADGLRRMPGALPDASAYTYAFAADIEQANGNHVTFNQPLIFYVEDFIGIKQGDPVPIGSYDEAAGAWAPEPSDVVVKIVGITGGYADLDVFGYDGVADTNLAASQYAISDAERQQLAQTYSVGTRLIRARLRHFSKWDLNWGLAPPNNGGPPNGPPPSGGGSDPCQSQRAGSILECEHQALAEEMPIAGTPYVLRYQSDRTKGRLTSIRIPLTGSIAYDNDSNGAIPKRIDWKVNVAGREFTGESTDMSVNQSVDFTWDGLDAFGRRVQGRTPIDIRVGNTFAASYATTSAFGYNGNGLAIDGTPGTNELTIWKEDQVIVGSYDAGQLGLGGWSLSSHHALEIDNGDIYLGTGAIQHFDPVAFGNAFSAYRMDWVGGDPSKPEQDGVSAKESSLSFAGGVLPTAIAADPDGSVWISYGGLDTLLSANTGIRRIRPDGIIEHIAGLAPLVALTDGVVAEHAPIRGSFLRVAPNGDLVVVDANGNSIWRITNENPRRIRLVAGTGAGCVGGTCGDGGPATSAQVDTPQSVAFDDANNMYIAQAGTGGKVRKIDPVGKISSLFAFGSARDVEVDGLGVLYVRGVNDNVSRWPLTAMTSQSPATALASPYNPGIATAMFLDASKHVVFASASELRVANANSTPDFRRVGGGGISDPYNDARLANQAMFAYLGQGALTTAPDGSILLLDNQQRIRRLSKHPLSDGGIFRMAAANGKEVYEFNDHGKHLRTVSALTGATLTQFTYDPGTGLLASILDGNSNTTTYVNRSIAGQVRFEAPHGKNSTLALDANNNLSRFTDPTGAHWDFTTRADGLLTQMIDSRSGYHNFEYDPSGRISRDSNELGDAQILSKTYTSTGYTVEAKSAMNFSTFYSSADAKDATRQVTVRRRTKTTPRNATYTSDLGSDGIRTSTEPNGMVTTSTQTPDPRYGTFAPLFSTEVRTPVAGRNRYTAESVAVTLANPLDPYSIQTELRTTSRNDASCSLGGVPPIWLRHFYAA